jgi:hypothetical protein
MRIVYQTVECLNLRGTPNVWTEFWHGYVLHEGIIYKSRVPRTSQMTSRLLCHTAAAMRAHNVLCISYNSRDKSLQLSSCKFLTCEMYKSSLRHIHDPVFSSLKMKGIRLLFRSICVSSSIQRRAFTLTTVGFSPVLRMTTVFTTEERTFAAGN